MIHQLQKAMQPLANRLKALVGKALIASVDNATKVQLLKLVALDGDVIADVERIQEYGLDSNPPNGSEVIFAALGGNRDHVVALKAGYSKDRPTDGEPGDSGLWSIHKNRVRLTKDGIFIEDQFDNVISLIDGKITISGESVELNGSTKSFVTHSELSASLATFLTALNAHVHPVAGAVAGIMSPPIALDISSAQTTTIKTGG